MNRLIGYFTTTGFSYFCNSLYQLFIPYYFLRQFDIDVTATWLMATSVFILLTSLDFGILQYVQYKFKRLGTANVKADNRKFKYICSLNCYLLMGSVWVTLICISSAIFFFPNMLILSVCISFSYLNRSIFIILRANNKLNIANLIVSIPVIFIMVTATLLKTENVDQFSIYYLFGYLVSITINFTALLKLDHPLGILLNNIKLIKAIKDSLRFWLLNISQVSNQFLPLVVIGLLYSSKELVLFSTIRTLMVLPLSLTLIVNNAVQPILTEFIKFSSGERNKLLYKWKWRFYLFISSNFIVILVMSDYIFYLWVKDNITFSTSLACLLALRTLLLIYVYTEQNINVAFGKPLKTIYYEIGTLLGLAIGFTFCNINSISINVFLFSFMILPTTISIIGTKLYKK